MNRSDYMRTRSLVRANGVAAYKYMPAEHANEHRHLHSIACEVDMLDWRARWMANPDTSKANIFRLTTPERDEWYARDRALIASRRA